jgi:hypothetical protein
LGRQACLPPDDGSGSNAFFLFEKENENRNDSMLGNNQFGTQPPAWQRTVVRQQQQQNLSDRRITVTSSSAVLGNNKKENNSVPAAHSVFVRLLRQWRKSRWTPSLFQKSIDEFLP